MNPKTVPIVTPSIAPAAAKGYIALSASFFEVTALPSTFSPLSNLDNPYFKTKYENR